MDRDSEYLSFPTIFCGKRRPNNNERKVPVSYSTVAKWELRCQDRRAAKSVPNIFYKLKKLQIKQIQVSACISLRKCQTKGKKYTAGDLKSEDYLNKLVHLDEGFRVFKNLRGSPPYFVLQMSMRRSSRSFQFISALPPDKRTFLLKKLDKLKALPDNSHDIESDNIIKRYQRRPKQLERLCLADFVAWFDSVKDEHSDRNSNQFWWLLARN